jgi:hypothetical protein
LATLSLLTATAFSLPAQAAGFIQNSCTGPQSIIGGVPLSECAPNTEGARYYSVGACANMGLKLCTMVTSTKVIDPVPHGGMQLIKCQFSGFTCGNPSGIIPKY